MTGGAGRTTLPALAIAGSAIMWGLVWIPVRRLEAAGLTGDRVSLVLFGAAAAFMLPALLWRHRRGALSIDRPALASGALFGGMMVGWNHALLDGEVVRVTLLFYMAPVWATLLGFLILGDRPTRTRTAGIVCGISGAAVILGASWSDLPLPRGLPDWLALGGGVMFAGSATINRAYGETGEVERTFSSFALAALFAALLVMATPEAAGPGLTGQFPAVAAGIAVGAFYLIPLTWLVMWGSGRLDPGRVALLLLFEVLAAAVSAAILTDEPFGPREWIGGGLIVAAALLEGRGSPGPADPQQDHPATPKNISPPGAG